MDAVQIFEKFMNGVGLMIENAKSLCAIFLGCALSGSVFAQQSPPDGSSESLCTEKEDIYFSCHLDQVNKIASVCAAKNTSPGSGYVQYRYGTKGKLDFKYPSLEVPPGGNFSIIDVSRLAVGLGRHLKFSNGKYQYVVSNALVPGEVYAVKEGKVIFDKFCKGSGYIPFSEKVESGITPGKEEPVDGLDHHNG